MKYPTAITLLISICALTAAAAAVDEDWKLRRSKLIATLEVDRQLGGSKSSKAFAGKGSKASRQSAKSAKSAQQTKATPQADTSSADTYNKPTPSAQPLRPHAIFMRRKSRKSNKSAKSNSSKSSKSVKAVEGSTKSSKSSHPAPEAKPFITAPVTPKVNLITPPPSPHATGVPTPPPSPLATGVPRQDHSFSNTNTDSSDEEIVTQFLEDNGDYTGLRTQNLALGISAVLALLATIVGVAVMRKRTSNKRNMMLCGSCSGCASMFNRKAAGRAKNAHLHPADNSNNNTPTILDSLEISPAVAGKSKAPSTNAAPVDNTNYSCSADLFGLSSMWA
jgi:hypothetical protein